MCCRYWIERSPEMDPIIDEVNKSPLTALILPGELVDEWICPDTNPDDLLGNALTDMVFEKVVEG